MHLSFTVKCVPFVYVTICLSTDNITLCTIKVVAHNAHAKSSYAPPNQYKATLCTTKVYIGTELHCQPWFACTLWTSEWLYCIRTKSVSSMFHVNHTHTKNYKCWMWPLLLKKVGPLVHHGGVYTWLIWIFAWDIFGSISSDAALPIFYFGLTFCLVVHNAGWWCTT